MFHGGGGGGPEPVKTIDKSELDRQQSDAEAAQRGLAKKRRGVASTRLTDPITDTVQPQQKTRVSLLGGGTYGS